MLCLWQWRIGGWWEKGTKGSHRTHCQISCIWKTALFY